MTALIVLVFLSYRAVAEPDAQGGATTGEISPIAEPRAKMTDARKARQLLERIAEATHSADDVIQHAKVAAGANANARLSLDLIANGGSGNRRNDGVTSGTVSGRGTTIAIEIFATGVTTPLAGMQLRFDFDASLVTFVKAENSAFAFNVPLPTGTDFAATSPVTLPSSGFLTRAEFTTVTDVTGREFSIGIASVTLSESQSSSDRLITRNRISFNVPTTLTPDFDGDGMVGFSDFLAFAGRYGTRRGDSRYQAKYDLNSDGAIGFSDFLSFAGSYGKRVSSPNGGSSSPDLIVESPSVSDNTLTPGQSFTLQATVRNRGTGQSTATTLRYYQSSKSTISTSDREIGTDSVSGLSASGTVSESISLTAPSSAGTYYYGACVASVSGESNTDNNCSDGVRVTVEVKDDHSNTGSDATSLSLGGSRSGQIEPGGDVDYFRVQVSRSGILTVYTTGYTDTYGTLQNSFGSTLATDDDGGSGSNFSITRAVIAGTYYIAVQGYSPSTTGSYTVHAGVSSTAGAFHIDLVFPNDSDFTASQKALFQQAATHWMSIITEDLPDIDFSTNPVNQYSEWLSLLIRVNDTVDDLRIYVRSGEIDGLNNTLGQAGPLHIRRNSSLPSLGAILLDAADLKRLEEDGFLYSVILHEMGHVLGIGSLWSERGLLQNPSSNNPGADTHFTGARAIQAFDNAGGQNYTGAKVPIENERDKAPDTHWRERVLDHELMTGWIEGDTAEPLSAITIQSLADLGYRVDISRADAYSLPDPTQVSAKTAEGHGLSFENCIRSGPIYVVDEQGRVLRIIENEEHPAKE